jgi:tripartite-type tricarboxylate transporter receptor subunit TctC
MESGLSGYEAGTWYGLLAPAATPPAIINRLHAQTVRALADEEVRRRLVEEGLDPVGNTPAEFAAYIRAEMTKWAGVIKAAGVVAEH